MVKTIRIFIRKNKKYFIIAIPILIIILLAIIKLVIVSKNDVKVSARNDEVIDVLEDEIDEYYYVDIKGCVKYPGVYKMAKGTRVKDVIELAGGLNEDSDTTNINLAKKVEDEMVIYINSISDNNSSNVSNNFNNSNYNNGLININKATIDELMTLSGIGEAKAKSIITYRENNGNFETIEDITKVSGIGQALYEKIKDYITV